MDEENTQNPLDVQKQAEKDPDVVKGIVKTETEKDKGPILEAAPEIDESLLEDLAPKKNIWVPGLKITFGLFVVLMIGSVLFFTSQITTKLDNITDSFGVESLLKQIDQTNEEITTFQSDLNFYRYLLIKGYMDEFSYYSDQYIEAFKVANSQTASEFDKERAKNDMFDAREKIIENFNLIKTRLALGITAPIFDIEKKEGLSEADLNNHFKQALTKALNEEAKIYQESDDPGAEREYRNIQNTVMLLANEKIKGLFKDTDISSLNSTELYLKLKEFTQLYASDLTAIQKIKDQRIKWSDILDEIEKRTIAIDRHYTENFYDDLGGIRYDSYLFDEPNRTITVTGETKTFDTAVFTQVLDILDEFDRSSMFESSDITSFSKSGNLEEGYTSALTLELLLEEDINKFNFNDLDFMDEILEEDVEAEDAAEEDAVEEEAADVEEELEEEEDVTDVEAEEADDATLDEATTDEATTDEVEEEESPAAATETESVSETDEVPAAVSEEPASESTNE